MCTGKIKKGIYNAEVVSNRHLGESFYRLGIEFSGEGAVAFGQFKPGQFLEMDLSRVSLPADNDIADELKDSSERRIILRRPFSIADMQRHGDKSFVEILYCCVGPASLRMTTLVRGQKVSVIGPLGNGFSKPVNKSKVLLAVGGMGAGPIEHMAKELKIGDADIEILTFAGAQSVDALPFERPFGKIEKGGCLCFEEFSKYGIETIVATDDGSAGNKGFVTGCIEKWLVENSFEAEELILYCCGPEGMLGACAKLAEKFGIDCQVSMERRMACGIGLCQGCAIECRVENSDETIYKMCCKDGPVFDSREVVF